MIPCIWARRNLLPRYGQAGCADSTLRNTRHFESEGGDAGLLSLGLLSLDFDSLPFDSLLLEPSDAFLSAAAAFE